MQHMHLNRSVSIDYGVSDLKKYRIILFSLAVFLFFSACFVIPALGNNMQAVFSCIRTSLKPEAAFTVINSMNHREINAEILKHNEARMTVTDQNNHKMLYEIKDTQMQVFSYGMYGRIFEKRQQLSVSPLALLRETEAVLTENNNSVRQIKTFLDSLLTKTINTEKDSSYFINFDVLPQTLCNIKDFLCSKDAQKLIDMTVKTEKLHKTTNVRVRDTDALRSKLGSLFAECLNESIRDSFIANLELNQNNTNGETAELHFEINTGLFGTLKSIFIFQNDQEMMRIIKTK